MKRVLSILAALPPAARLRVVEWASSRAVDKGAFEKAGDSDSSGLLPA